MNVVINNSINFFKISKPKHRVLVLFVFIISLLFLIWIYNNCQYYATTIGKVLSVEEQTYGQDLHLIIKNGKHKSKEIMVTNPYHKDLVYSEKYTKGDFLFINIPNQSEETMVLGLEEQSANTNGINIIGQKRDYFLGFLLFVFLNLLVFVGGKQGFFTILGCAVNIFIYYISIVLFVQGYNILILSIFMMIVFSLIILILINGFSKETLVALTASLATTGIVAILSILIIHVSPRISYEYLNFLPEPFDDKSANQLLVAQIMIGSLGVIIDIAMTITAAAMAIIRKSPKISNLNLLKSIRAVEGDITGTMITLVFFTNIAGIIPIFLISMYNDISFITVIQYSTFFETIRFVTSATAIVLAIPLSTFVAITLLKKKLNNQKSSPSENKGGIK